MGDAAKAEIEDFITFIARRGVPARYHQLYRDELVAVLLHAGVGSVDRLDGAALSRSVQEAQARLNNRKAVCAALDIFRRNRSLPRTAAGQEARPPAGQEARPPAGQEEGDFPPDSIAGSRSVAVAASSGSEHRKFVRVPFNCEVDVDGSMAHNRSSDLSIGGMYLDTLQHYEVGAVMGIAFKLHPSDRQPLRLRALVVHFDPGVGVGLDFVDPPRHIRHVIRRFVESYVLDR